MAWNTTSRVVDDSDNEAIPILSAYLAKFVADLLGFLRQPNLQTGDLLYVSFSPKGELLSLLAQSTRFAHGAGPVRKKVTKETHPAVLAFGFTALLSFERGLRQGAFR